MNFITHKPVHDREIDNKGLLWFFRPMEGNTPKVDIISYLSKLSVDPSRAGTVQAVANYLADTVLGGVNAFRLSLNRP